MNEPDPALISRAASGDRHAFADIVRLYQDPVWRFLSHLLGDPHSAEDATQETFLRVHRHLTGFEARSKFSTWLFRIARNTGLDMARQRARRPKVVADLAVEPPSVQDHGVRTEIAAALASLPVSQREAILIVEVLGYNYREAAALTGIAEGTFKSRVHHGRIALHVWFETAERAGEL
jgi:RNA polymerase sigma-70 factor, ECF subfamily